MALPSPMIPLHIVRRVQYWFQLSNQEHVPAFAGLPVYIWDLGSGGSFYGFPLQSEQKGVSKGGVKVALHQVSDGIDDDGVMYRQQCDPETIDRIVSEEETKSMKQLLKRQIPLLGDDETAGLLETATCMYTMTPDSHFIIDFFPGQGLGPGLGPEQGLGSAAGPVPDALAQGLGTDHHHCYDQDIVIISACSGHGFKFATVIGEIVEQLISRQTTSHDISLFSIRRFGTGASS